MMITMMLMTKVASHVEVAAWSILTCVVAGEAGRVILAVTEVAGEVVGLGDVVPPALLPFALPRLRPVLLCLYKHPRGTKKTNHMLASR